MTDVTAGDLDPERDLYYYSRASRAHFPDADCSCARMPNAARARQTTAGVLFDDTPICKNCLGADYRGRNGGNQPLLPTTTEVPEV